MLYSIVRAMQQRIKMNDSTTKIRAQQQLVFATVIYFYISFFKVG